MRTVDFFVSASCLLSTLPHAAAQTPSQLFCAGLTVPDDSFRAAKSLQTSPLQHLPIHGRVRALVMAEGGDAHAEQHGGGAGENDSAVHGELL